MVDHELLQSVVLITSLMMIAGILGAAVSTALTKEERTWTAFKWNCLIGIGASFLIPVFLNTVSSHVLIDIAKTNSDASQPTLDQFLVFFGFCVLGAVSARHLITTLSEKVLQIARSAEKVAQEAKREAQETKASAEQTKKVALATKDAIQYGIKEDGLEIPASPAVSHFERATVDAALQTEDPWKGKFGGNAEANGRTLEAEVTRLTDLGDTAAISLRVSATDRLRPLTGTVQFFIHQSFGKYDPIVPVVEGAAVLNLTSWGAFTVGAVCDEGATQLELDLSQHPDAWEPWKSR